MDSAAASSNALAIDAHPDRQPRSPPTPFEPDRPLPQQPSANEGALEGRLTGRLSVRRPARPRGPAALSSVRSSPPEAWPRIAAELAEQDENPLTGLHRRFEVLPGAQAQVDWGDEGDLLADVGIGEVYSFHMILSYSRDPFCCFTTVVARRALPGGRQASAANRQGLPDLLRRQPLLSSGPADPGRTEGPGATMTGAVSAAAD
jgi:hypothetical protein